MASVNKNSSFSEAVIVHFQVEVIPLKTSIELHLLTHKSTSNHSIRKKYQSAIYTFSHTHVAKGTDLLSIYDRLVLT